MDGMSGHLPQHQKQRNWGAIGVAVLTILIAGGLAAYAAAASYESVSGLAAANHVPLPYLNPVGIDGGLFGVITLDIALTWLGQPIGWLRLFARLFAAGTVAANFASGWPDTTGAILRVAAPVLFVVIAEVARTRLLRKHRAEGGEHGVPFSRWVLAPGSTFRLWRRMKLWRITDYGKAIDMELSRRQAIEELCAHYGTRSWRVMVPGDLVWMLDGGVRMDAALAKVAVLTAPQALPAGASASATRRPASARGKRSASGRSVGIDKQAQALALYHANRDITGADLGRALGLSASRGRAILQSVKATAPDTGQMQAVRETAER